MQPNEEHKGVSTKSQLFDSLRVYLNNQNRLQPIIGLGSIIECVKAGTHNREVLYLCEVCVCRLSKADMRNHIMGSLHRYNYIKTWHPHLVSECKQKSDLSKLAWPLMEMAKILERKEGPGNIHWLEVEDALYQKMATHSETDALTLIAILRDGQGQGEPESHSETTSVQLEHHPIQSQRIVLLSRSPDTFKTSAETNKTVALIKSEGFLNNTSHEPSALSENGNSLFDSYTGSKPLIGLFRLVECRSEDGHTYCFLCHCCRIRCNKEDIIDHLTSSSHVVNYLMETYPEQVEVMTADINDNYQLLQSLAKKVEQKEGRGEPKVVNAPESLCILLTGKSYHWCIKMLCSGWTPADIQEWKKAVKGLNVNKTSNQGVPEKCAMVPSQCAKRMTAKRKLKKVTNTVFKVSLPLTKGSLLLERTPVSVDSPPVSSAYSPSSDSDFIPLPVSESEGRELDYDTGSFAINHTSQLKQDLHKKDANAGQYMRPESNLTVTVNQEVDGYFNNNEYFNQSEDITGTKYQKVDKDDYNNRQHGSQERSRKRFYKKWQNKCPQTQNEWLSPAASHTEHWPSYNYYYGCEAGCPEQWSTSAPQSEVGSRVSREERLNEMSSGAIQHYYQQQPQNQYMAQDHTSVQTASVGQQGLSGELSAHSDPARINMHPHTGDAHAHSGSFAPQPGGWFLDFEQRQLQTYKEFTTGHVLTAQQNYMTQSTAHQVIQVGHGVTSHLNYNSGSSTSSVQHFPHPLSGGGGYGAHSDLNVRGAGLSGLTISGGSDGTSPFMFSYPNFNSAYITTRH